MFWSKIKAHFFEEESKVDYLLIGLGNPREKYSKTAHNAGFRVIDFFQEKNNFAPFSKDNTLNALSVQGTIEGKKVALIKPLSFMNLSGGPVKKSLKKFCLPAEKMIIVQDDADIPLGVLRFSFARNAGGHKGVESIIKSIKTKNFFRLRVGVGKKEAEKAKELVLKGLPPYAEKTEEKAAEELKKSVLSGPVARTIKEET